MDEDKLQQAIANPQNLGEMNDADAVGTVGSPDCGDMVRLWLKYREKDGKKVIDRQLRKYGLGHAISVFRMST